MNVKNLTRDLADMGYRPLEVSLHGNLLCIFIVFQVIFDIICILDRNIYFAFDIVFFKIVLYEIKTDINCQCCFSVPASYLKGVSIWTSMCITM